MAFDFTRQQNVCLGLPEAVVCTTLPLTNTEVDNPLFCNRKTVFARPCHPLAMIVSECNLLRLALI